MTSITDIRLIRGAQKTVNHLFWKSIARRLPPPCVEVFYEGEVGAKGVVYRLGEPAFIEPTVGYVITQRGVLIEESLRPNFDFDERPLKISVPSLYAFGAARRQPSRCIKVSSALSTRHFWEWNYYHFLFDVLGRLELMQRAGLMHPSRPLAAAGYIDDVNFGRGLVSTGSFAGYSWLTSATQFVSAPEIYFGRTQAPFKQRIDYILEMLSLPQSSAGRDRRIFLTRTSNRRITNIDALLPVLRRYGFDVVDTALMSVLEQSTLFASTRYVIANHGAGTTNIIFRGNGEMSVLELHSRYITFVHKQICTEMGYGWDSLEGLANTGIAQPDFTIAPERLEQKIQQMLSA